MNYFWLFVIYAGSVFLCYVAIVATASKPLATYNKIFSLGIALLFSVPLSLVLAPEVPKELQPYEDFIAIGKFGHYMLASFVSTALFFLFIPPNLKKILPFSHDNYTSIAWSFSLTFFVSFEVIGPIALIMWSFIEG